MVPVELLTGALHHNLGLLQGEFLLFCQKIIMCRNFVLGDKKQGVSLEGVVGKEDVPKRVLLKP